MSIVKDEFHTIARLHREDVEQCIGKERADLLSDADIEHIAKDMGNAYLESGYWEDLEVIAEAMLGEGEDSNGQNQT